jgi:ATP-dependent Clp protease ATP-binding subunit ClpB
LKRTIQAELENPLAKAIIAGEIREGDTVTVDRGKNGLIFPAPPQPPAVSAQPPAV